MKFIFTLLTIALLFTTTHIVNVHAEGNETDTRPICVKYGGETLESQMNYMTAILSNAAFGNTTFNESFVGLFGETSPVLQWFDGTYLYRSSGVRVNFTTNHGGDEPTQTLLSHMIAFFGPALGCNATGFPSYNTTDTLYDIHRNMNYGKSEFDFFISQFLYSFQFISSNYTMNETDHFGMYLSEFGRCAPGNNQTCNDMSCDVGRNSLTTEECQVAYPSELSSSICSKYTYILSSQNQFKGGDSVQNEQMLMHSIIQRAFIGDATTTPPVPGIMSTDSPLLPWFNGTFKYRPDAPDYAKNVTLSDQLIAHLVSYVGDLLLCQAPGWKTSPYNFSYGSYDVFEVHRNMSITNTMMNYFIQQLDLSLQSMSVSDMDRQSVNTTTRVFYRYGDLVYGFRGQICGDMSCDLAEPNDPSLYTTPSLSSTGTYHPPLPLCERYFGNTSDFQIGNVTALLSLAAFGNTTLSPLLKGILSVDSPLLPFFNGQIIYREDGKPVDFTINHFDSDDFRSFFAHLLSYFLRVFECQSDSLPPINNANVWAIHRNMKISGVEFSYFNDQIVYAAAVSGFDAEDVQYLNNSLAFFGTCAPNVWGGFAQVCNANITGPGACPISTNPLLPADCFAAYQDNLCTRLTMMNTNYDGVMSEADFLQKAVTILFNGTTDKVVQGLLYVNSSTYPYFTGEIQYNGNATVNYTNNVENYQLIESMVMKTYTHLGQLLGCNAPGYGLDVYKFKAPRQDLFYVHQNMNIDSSVFEYYNDQVVKTLLSLRATQADVATVLAALAGYGKCGIDENGHLLEICSGDGCGDATQTDCSIYPGRSSSDDSNRNKIIIGVAVGVGGLLLLLIACYCYRKRSGSTSSSRSAHESTRLMNDDSDADYRSTR